MRTNQKHRVLSTMSFLPDYSPAKVPGRGKRSLRLSEIHGQAIDFTGFSAGKSKTFPDGRENAVVGGGVPYRIRTGVAAVRGRCPGPLDEGDEVCRLNIARCPGDQVLWQAPCRGPGSVTKIQILQRLLDLHAADHGDRLLQVVALLAGHAQL